MAFIRDGGREAWCSSKRTGSGHEKTANTWGARIFLWDFQGQGQGRIARDDGAATRSTQEKPEFYMYFPPTGNLGGADTITSPGQFSLLALEEKKDHRETAVVNNRVWKRKAAGTDEKRTFKFDVDKNLAPTHTRSTPSASLNEGEYAFCGHHPPWAAPHLRVRLSSSILAWT